MKRWTRSLYAKISAVFLVLLLTQGVIHTLLSVRSSMNFVRESDQKLNRGLAHDLAKEFRPFLRDSLDVAGIEHTIHHLMVMNPRVEIYLLDGSGKILAFFADPAKKVKTSHVGLTPVRKFLEKEGDLPILGDDPRNPGGRKPFSVAALEIGKEIHGFLYIILGGEQYDSASAMIRDSYIVRTTALSLGVTVLLTGVVGLILFAFLTKRFHSMTLVVRKFAAGDYTQRIGVQSDDEIGQLSRAFDQMADTIVANMEELKRTDDLRRELIANVSHDLRSPLASMQGYLETVLMKDAFLSAEERRRYLQVIFDNTRMLSQLVSELFELSKLDAKQVQPKPEPFSIAELAQDVMMKFKPQAEKLQVKLESSLPKNLPMVVADIGMIERALSNFIDNALCYTPAEGTVSVDLRQEGGKVRVVVSDTGCGIPADDLPAVFDRFYRVDKSRARSSGGSGLGLAIAKKILEAHDTPISVQSTLDVGTRFAFDLRCSESDSFRN